MSTIAEIIQRLVEDTWTAKIILIQRIDMIGKAIIECQHFKKYFKNIPKTIFFVKTILLVLYIVIHRQTVSFYQNSSLWLDTRSRDRNIYIYIYIYIRACIYIYIYIYRSWHFCRNYRLTLCNICVLYIFIAVCYYNWNTKSVQISVLWSVFSTCWKGFSISVSYFNITFHYFRLISIPTVSIKICRDKRYQSLRIVWVLE